MSDTESSEGLTLDDLYQTQVKILKKLDIIIKQLSKEVSVQAAPKNDDGYVRFDMTPPVKSKGPISVSDILAGAHKFN